ITPGRRFWTSTSTPPRYSTSHATAPGDRRSRVMERLLALAAWKTDERSARNGGPQPRASSPPSGRSTFTTSAPSRARISPANGPARFCAISTTLIPASGSVDLVRDRRGDPRRLARPHLGDADLEGGVAPVGRAERVGGRDVRRRGVTGEDREVLLDGLIRADRLAELPALGRVARGQLQNSV